MMMAPKTNSGGRDVNPPPGRSRSRSPVGNLGGPATNTAERSSRPRSPEGNLGEPATNAAEDEQRGRESAAVDDVLHPSLARSEHRAKTSISVHSTCHVHAETHLDMNADITCDYDSQLLLISRQGYDRVPHYSPNSPLGQEGHPSPSPPSFSYQGGPVNKLLNNPINLFIIRLLRNLNLRCHPRSSQRLILA